MYVPLGKGDRVTHPPVPRWAGRLRKAVALGLDLVFPPRCAGCGQPGQVWCEACDRSLARLAPPFCRRCGMPSPRGSSGCVACRGLPWPQPTRSYAFYEGPLVSALLALKYRPDRDLARRMAGWLAALVQQAGWQPDLVVPVPLGRDRARRRGFNQAGLLAEPLAEQCRGRAMPEALRRVRETGSQVGLDPVARRENVAGAFRAEQSLVGGKRVLLVDDLCTTGATLAACTAALREAGATQVWAVTVARARRWTA